MIVELEHLRVSRGDAFTLRLDHLSLHAGARLAVCGPSGAGKTSLLHALAGLLPCSGALRVLGADPREAGPALRRAMGLVFQDATLLPELTALENVQLPGRLGGPRVPRRRAEALLDALGLAARRRHRPGALSTGERRRVAIARALAAEPALVLADEPTAGLDAAAIERVLDLFAEFEGALIVTSHDSQMLAAFPQRVELGGA